MQSHLGLWANLLAKLGIAPKKHRSQSAASYRRKLSFEQCEDRRMLATFTVNSVLDNTTSGDGLTTLREAVNAANQLDDADEIVFHSSLNGGVITITGGNLLKL